MPAQDGMRPIAAIVVGDRHRARLGDLKALAVSMDRVGLLHALVVTPDNRLVAGARRLAAAQMLGWTEISVRVIDVPSMLQAEHDENELREPFLPSEAVAIGRALEEEIAARNAEKQRQAGQQYGRGHPHRKLMDNFHKLSPEPQTTRDQVGDAIGLSGRTYSKAKAVVVAAEQAPDIFGDLARQMDATGNVDRAYQTLKHRVKTAERAAQPGHAFAAQAYGLHKKIIALGDAFAAVLEAGETVEGFVEKLNGFALGAYMEDIETVYGHLAVWRRTLKEVGDARHAGESTAE